MFVTHHARKEALDGSGVKDFSWRHNPTSTPLPAEPQIAFPLESSAPEGCCDPVCSRASGAMRQGADEKVTQRGGKGRGDPQLTGLRPDRAVSVPRSFICIVPSRTIGRLLRGSARLERRVCPRWRSKSILPAGREVCCNPALSRRDRQKVVYRIATRGERNMRSATRQHFFTQRAESLIQSR